MAEGSYCAACYSKYWLGAYVPKRSARNIPYQQQNRRYFKMIWLLWEKSETTPSDSGNQTSFAALSSNETGEDRPNGTPEQSSSKCSTITIIIDVYRYTVIMNARHCLNDGSFGSRTDKLRSAASAESMTTPLPPSVALSLSRLN